MKKLIYIFMALFLFNCNKKVDAQPEKFNFTISVMVKGSYKIREYKIDNKQVIVTFFSTNYNIPPEIKFQRNISKVQELKFSEFLKKFPITELKDSYIEDLVEGEQSLYFEITYKDIYKKIYVYYQEPEELVRLVKELNKFIPQEFQFYF